MGRKRQSGQDLPSRVYKKHGAYYFIDKDKKWHRLGKDFYEAMIKYAELNDQDIPCTTLSPIIDRYLKEIIPNKAPSTQRTNFEEVKLLRGVFGHMKPEEVEPQDIYKYMDARQAPIRANRELALLSNIYSYAIRWGYAKDNPCKLVKRNKEKPRDRYVTDKEFWAVYDIAEYSPVIQVAMMLTAITGLRSTDLRELKYSQCAEQGLVVTLSKTKNRTGKTIIFEWSDELKEIIDRSKKLHDTEKKKAQITSMYILSNRKGQPYTASGFKAMFRRTMLKAKEEGIEWFQFRDIRAKAGSDDEDGSLLGHSDTKTLNKHYRRKPQLATPLSLKR